MPGLSANIACQPLHLLLSFLHVSKYESYLQAIPRFSTLVEKYGMAWVRGFEGLACETTTTSLS